MHFTFRRPCGNCPFRTDCLKGWLGQPRAQEIANGLLVKGSTFACHKTTKSDDEGESYSDADSQHCAGALILLEKLDKPSQMMRIAERLRLYDRHKLDMTAPVFESTQAFIKHHK